MTLRERWNHYLSHDAPPLVQFIKYGMAGGVATVVHVLTFFTVGFFLFPCVSADDPLMKGLTALFGVAAPAVDEALRARVIAGTCGAGELAYVTINNKAEGSAPLSVAALAEAVTNDAPGQGDS